MAAFSAKTGWIEGSCSSWSFCGDNVSKKGVEWAEENGFSGFSAYSSLNVPEVWLIFSIVDITYWIVVVARETMPPTRVWLTEREQARLHLRSSLIQYGLIPQERWARIAERGSSNAEVNIPIS
jgi:hypothetical protein